MRAVLGPRVTCTSLRDRGPRFFFSFSSSAIAPRTAVSDGGGLVNAPESFFFLIFFYRFGFEFRFWYGGRGGENLW